MARFSQTFRDTKGGKRREERMKSTGMKAGWRLEPNQNEEKERTEKGTTNKKLNSHPDP